MHLCDFQIPMLLLNPIFGSHNRGLRAANLSRFEGSIPSFPGRVSGKNPFEDVGGLEF